MGIKKLMLNTNSKNGKYVYTKLLKWLDSPNRTKYDNPDLLVMSSGIVKGQTVLEIGCGSGFFTIAASRLLGENGRLYATDIHSIAIDETKNKITNLGIRNVTVLKDDALHSIFPDNFFDGILVYGVVPSPVISMTQIASEMHRILKSSGNCAIWTKIPFWEPSKAMEMVGFSYHGKINDVYNYKK